MSPAKLQTSRSAKNLAKILEKVHRIAIPIVADLHPTCLSTIVENTMHTNSFAFVLNPFHYTGAVPIELMPDMFLDRADDLQRKTIEELRDQQGHAGTTLAFRHEPIPIEIRNSPDWDRILPPRTTFWVINFFGDPEPVFEFSHAAQLTGTEVEIGASFPQKEQILIPRIINPWRIHSFFERFWNNDAQPLNPNDLKTARLLVQKLREFRAVSADQQPQKLVVRVFDDFVDLSREHRFGHLALLGHFALIEALVTHDAAQSGRSLTHQLATKMPLLMRRFAQPLLVSEFFDLADEWATWRLLYRARSAYAHGGEPNFEKPADQRGVCELRNLGEVFRFVRHSLKRLLMLALEEPRLIYDLKAC